MARHTGAVSHDMRAVTASHICAVIVSHMCADIASDIYAVTASRISEVICNMECHICAVMSHMS